MIRIEIGRADERLSHLARNRLMIVDDLLDTYRTGDSYHTRRRLVAVIGSHGNLTGTDLQRSNDTIRVNSSHRLVAAAPRDGFHSGVIRVTFACKAKDSPTANALDVIFKETPVTATSVPGGVETGLNSAIIAKDLSTSISTGEVVYFSSPI